MINRSQDLASTGTRCLEPKSGALNSMERLIDGNGSHAGSRGIEMLATSLLAASVLRVFAQDHATLFVVGLPIRISGAA